MRSSFFVVVLSLSASAASFDRAALERSVKQARVESPEVFARVRGVVEQADALQGRSRGRLFPFPAMLRSMTKRDAGAAFALVEPLVAPERFTMPLTPRALVALRAGLLEAAGSLREPSLAPVYRSFIVASEPREVTRAAAEALAKLGVEADAAMLSKLALTEGALQDSAISALGSFGNGAMVMPALRSLSTTRMEPPRAKLVAGSFARVANGWSGQKSWSSDAAQGALVLFVNATSDEVRDAASDALMVIDAPNTPQLIAAARAEASPALLAALDALNARFAHNPTRSHR